MISLILVLTMTWPLLQANIGLPVLAFPSDWVAHPMHVVSSDALVTHRVSPRRRFEQHTIFPQQAGREQSLLSVPTTITRLNMT